MRAKYAERLQLFRQGATTALAGGEVAAAAGPDAVYLGADAERELREASGGDLAAYGRVYDEMKAKPVLSWIEP